ncbi:hypothetical protein J6590_031362 [Homalodisca vitripennis]|nr:hypothetical protein J6590_031362 [Homalodisca vitripennis]
MVLDLYQLVSMGNITCSSGVLCPARILGTDEMRPAKTRTEQCPEPSCRLERWNADRYLQPSAHNHTSVAHYLATVSRIYRALLLNPSSAGAVVVPLEALDSREQCPVGGCITSLHKQVLCKEHNKGSRVGFVFTPREASAPETPPTLLLLSASVSLLMIGPCILQSSLLGANDSLSSRQRKAIVQYRRKHNFGRFRKEERPAQFVAEGCTTDPQIIGAASGALVSRKCYVWRMNNWLLGQRERAGGHRGSIICLICGGNVSLAKMTTSTVPKTRSHIIPTSTSSGTPDDMITAIIISPCAALCCPSGECGEMPLLEVKASRAITQAEEVRLGRPLHMSRGLNNTGEEEEVNERGASPRRGILCRRVDIYGDFSSFQQKRVRPAIMGLNFVGTVMINEG